MAYSQSLEAAFESSSTYRAHTAPSVLSGAAYVTTGRGTGRGRRRVRGCG